MHPTQASPATTLSRFELIKELLKNRLRIVWCMRLARTENDEERQRVEAEMEGSSETRAILDALHATRATGTWLPTAKCTAGCIPFCAADNASVLAACREA
jgi:hypothetical protein